MYFLKKALPILLLSTATLASSAQVGNPAPNFTVTDTHGETHTLYDYLEAGKVVVLDFFYTTCGPCQFYSPQVNLAYEKYGCNNATVFFMSIDYQDNNAQVIAYDEQYEIQYPSVSGYEGGGNDVVDQYGVFAFPTFYVIDSSKTIIEVIDPPTLQVFDFRFAALGIQPANCDASASKQTNRDEGLAFFPNPVDATRSLQVRIVGGDGEGAARFEIFNHIGQPVRNDQLEFNSRHEAEMSVADLPSGIFLLKISPMNGSKTYAGFFVIK